MEYRKPSELTPHPTSVALYGDNNIDDLLERIRECGILVPLTINGKDIIISGHRRWRCALALELDQVPVEVKTFADEWAEKRAILDYNKQRDKTFSQKMNEVKLIKEIVAEDARRNKEATSKNAPRNEKGQLQPISLLVNSPVKTADIVGREIGIGAEVTFRRAEKIYDKAKEGDTIARELVAKLDTEDETIGVAYKRLVLSERGSELIQSLEASGKLDISTAHQISAIESQQKQDELAQLITTKHLPIIIIRELIPRVKAEIDRPAQDIYDDILTGKAQIDDAIRLEIAKNIAGIIAETPEELERAAKQLQEKAKRKRDEALTAELIAQQEAEKAAKKAAKKAERAKRKKEREEKAGQKADSLDPATIQAVLEREVEKNPTYVKRAEKNLKRKKKQEKTDAKKQEAIVIYPNADVIPIYTGDISLLYSKIEDNSADLVFTDPPYSENSLALFEQLAELAKAKLKVGGLCLTYAPHAHLDIILATMTKHLEYWWIFGINQTGAEARIWEKHLWVGWKPILAFIKQPTEKVDRLTEDWVRDWYRGTGEDKEHHEWGQAVDEARYWIEAFTLDSRRSLVIDPFCGGGTIPLACVMTGRNYIATDIDPHTAAIARKRVDEWQKQDRN